MIFHVEGCVEKQHPGSIQVPGFNIQLTVVTVGKTARSFNPSVKEKKQQTETKSGTCWNISDIHLCWFLLGGVSNPNKSWLANLTTLNYPTQKKRVKNPSFIEMVQLINPVHLPTWHHQEDDHGISREFQLFLNCFKKKGGVSQPKARIPASTVQIHLGLPSRWTSTSWASWIVGSGANTHGKGPVLFLLMLQAINVRGSGFFFLKSRHVVVDSLFGTSVSHCNKNLNKLGLELVNIL